MFTGLNEVVACEMLVVLVCVCVCTDAFISQVVLAEANIKINSLLSCSQKSPEGLANLLLSPAGFNFHFSNDNKIFIWNGCINAHKQPTTQTHRHTMTLLHVLASHIAPFLPNVGPSPTQHCLQYSHGPEIPL